MTRKLTPAQLDEIEAATIRKQVVHAAVNGEPDKRFATVLALIAEVRELRAKVERVREVHRRFSIYETCPEDGCENAHCFETAEGDYVHDDDLVGHVCYECSDLSDEEPIYWPCDTIKALGEEA